MTHPPDARSVVGSVAFELLLLDGGHVGQPIAFVVQHFAHAFPSPLACFHAVLRGPLRGVPSSANASTARA